MLNNSACDHESRTAFISSKSSMSSIVIVDPSAAKVAVSIPLSVLHAAKIMG
jgi:hypothetical protein